MSAPESSNAGIIRHSEHEARTIARVFVEPVVLSHELATRDAVLDALKDCDVCHFSCHGYADPNNPLAGGLVMHDGSITLDDILQIRLAGIRLAVLSACETGVPGTMLPDEIVHLPSGLLRAGVAGTISSLWPVPDLSTMLLMTRFYENWRRRKTEPPEALRQAQIWMRDSTNREKLGYFGELEKCGRFPHDAMKHVCREIGFSNPDARDFAHPYHWAAFQYVGV